METKTATAIKLFQEGSKKEALKLFKSFRFNISREEKRTLEISYECLTGKESFYNQLGVDVKAELQKANLIINNYINNYECN